MKTTRILFIFIIAFFTSCTVRQSNIAVIPLEKFTSVDTIVFKGKKVMHKTASFIISNWKEDKKSLHALDCFVISSIDSNIYSYGQYTMIFYKESDITNIRHLSENPRDLDRYSQDNDMIYNYIWFNGKLSMISEIKDGIVVNAKSEIKVGPAPPK